MIHLENIDCLIGMKKISDNSIDSIVTDSPYGLKFMGKKWDYDMPKVEIWQECLRILKPGGYLLAFAGTRTQHRMACNIEDGGFEIRDMIAWVYGSGFPKSHNVANAIDKKMGCSNRGHAISSGSKIHPSTGKPRASGELLPPYESRTKESEQWDGWGTALKPALEPITVARKPFSEKTVADNVLKWGTGGININGCRIETNEKITNHSRGEESAKSKGKYGDSKEQKTYQTKGQQQGRFPANFIHDGDQVVMNLFPDTKSGKPGTQMTGIGDSGSAARFFYCAKANKKDRDEGLDEFEEKTAGERTNRKEGSAGITAYAGGRCKIKNIHPTVKPAALMQYLVKLVMPPNGIVLDPFMGSGSTGKACM